MELREKIALACKQRLAELSLGHCEPFEVMADAILNLPEIKEALVHHISVIGRASA